MNASKLFCKSTANSVHKAVCVQELNDDADIWLVMSLPDFHLSNKTTDRIELANGQPPPKSDKDVFYHCSYFFCLASFFFFSILKRDIRKL